MTQNNENTVLTEVIIVQLSAVEPNELIAQLMIRIAQLRVELQKNQYLSIPSVDVNTPSVGRLPLHFPSLTSNSKHLLNNPPRNPTQNPSTIDLTASNLPHTSSSYQAQQPFQNLNTNPQLFPFFKN